MAGLGRNTASQIALKGAKVYIGARSEAKAQGAYQRTYKSRHTHIDEE